MKFLKECAAIPKSHLAPRPTGELPKNFVVLKDICTLSYRQNASERNSLITCSILSGPNPEPFAKDKIVSYSSVTKFCYRNAIDVFPGLGQVFQLFFRSLDNTTVYYLLCIKNRLFRALKFC